jgi:DNA-binding transcriptional regulator YhcF (GntR family)
MMQMAWELDADRPIYAQLVERIRMQIVSGYYQPGGKLPSVRELAATAAVNPNTMQKAFAELERTGLIITQRTNGRNVTEDEELIAGVKQGMAREHMEVFFSKMKELGFTKEEIKALVDGEIMQNVKEEGKGL